MLEHEIFEEPRYVAQVPFHRAGLRHRLHAAVLVEQWLDQILGAVTNSGILRKKRRKSHKASFGNVSLYWKFPVFAPLWPCWAKEPVDSMRSGSSTPFSRASSHSV